VPVTGGDPADLPTARDLAGQAATEFHRLDLPGPLSAADQLLRRIGTAERTTDPLTPRESEVVALIAQALTNRQIARRLVLSERTVETHVRHILAKLGLRTRIEIATRSLGAKPES
jgi:DNA-binding NarL/FixJ family response regulator